MGPIGESRGEVLLPDISKDSKSGFRKRNVSIWALRGELGGRASALETLKDMKIGSSNGIFFNSGPLGDYGGVSFRVDFKETIKGSSVNAECM